MINRFTLLLRTLLLFLSIGFSFHAAAQKNGKLIKIAPQWNVGDTKKVHVENSTRVEYDDSLVRNEKISYDVFLKVVEKNDFYTLIWSSKNDISLHQFRHLTDGETPYEKQLNSALLLAEDEILFAEFKLMIDVNSGIVKEWLNGKELLKNTEYHSKKKIKAWAVQNAITDKERLDLEIEFSKKLNTAYDIWRDLLLQKANNFFEPYNQYFTLNQTLTEKVMTADIMHLNDLESNFPGTMTKEAADVNGKLILDKKIEYEKAYIIQYLKKIAPTMGKLTESDVMIFEKEQTIYDIKSTWLVNYNKKLYFEVKGMKTTTNTTITFL